MNPTPAHVTPPRISHCTSAGGIQIATPATL
jgi:hypothetical protein